ncbi:hypothetical protein BDY24DRAFT_368161 [Mrakia frigida]|uniref:uncharacterized protein n=1 Tax=Mrakia frigida TaxID=29902 RepID=UPI003FCC2180
MKSFFLSLLLASQFAFAQPSSPSSSENDVAALRVIKKRQATSKQIVERMRAGPRRRTDLLEHQLDRSTSKLRLPYRGSAYSSLPVLKNGDFQTADPTHVSPWRWFALPSTMRSTTTVYSGPYVYADPSDTGGHWSLSWSHDLSPRYRPSAWPEVYPRLPAWSPRLRTELLPYHGFGGSPILLRFSSSDKSITFNDYCRTGDTSCTKVGTNLPTFKKHTLSDISFAATASTVSFAFDCTSMATGSAYRYIVDNVSLKC